MGVAILGAPTNGAIATVTTVSKIVAAAPIGQIVPLLGLFASMDACLGLLTWRSTLRPVDTRRVLGAPPACTSLCVGAQVRVKGLSNTASNRYNGLQGTIVGRESKRWIVRARGLGEDLVLRGRNLEITGCIPRTSKRGPKGGGGGGHTRHRHPYRPRKRHPSRLNACAGCEPILFRLRLGARIPRVLWHGHVTGLVT